MTLAKAIGAGFPLSAIGARSDVMTALGPGDHGSTFGGNPVSCAAALAGIDAMEAEELPQRASELGVEVDTGRAENDRSIAEAIQRAALDRGLLVITSGPAANVVRILPPLVITDDELDHGLAVLESAFAGSLSSA